ncbi:MAG: cytochrome P450 [Aeromicrobium sp.]
MGLPLIGHTLEYIRDPQALFQKHWDAYGPVSTIGMLGKPWVMLLGPDACEAALRNADKAFANEPGWSFLVGPFFGRGLMLLDFEEHHMHRRIMQQAFTRQRLEGYTAGLQPVIRAGLSRWRDDRDFRAYPALKQLTLEVAAEIFMGGAEHTTPAEMARINRAFIDCVQTATGIVRKNVPGTRWHRGTRARRLLEEFLRSYLPARRATKTDDLFSALCHIESDEGETFSDDDIINHMIFLLMAAHDTSTITLSTMLQYLGQHPEWQEHCRLESEALGPEPTLAELDGLTSLDLVMKECLRLVSPVPVMARKTVKRVDVLGVTIPADHFVFVAPHFSHLMEEFWTSPASFDPERFSAERREDKSHRYAWEPFGGGVHKCLGMFFAGAEVKTIMHQLLRDFTWSVDPDYRVSMNYHSLPFPDDGQPINLARR